MGCGPSVQATEQQCNEEQRKIADVDVSLKGGFSVVLFFEDGSSLTWKSAGGLDILDDETAKFMQLTKSKGKVLKGVSVKEGSGHVVLNLEDDSIRLKAGSKMTVSHRSDSSSAQNRYSHSTSVTFRFRPAR